MGDTQGHKFHGNQYKTVKIAKAPVEAPVLLVPHDFPKIEEPIIVLPPEYIPPNIPEKEVFAHLEKEKPNWLARAWTWVIQ
jgi:hypothetical protein